MMTARNCDDDHFATRGWVKIPASQDILQWARAAQAYIDPCLVDPAQVHWWRLDRSWFAGVNCLPNDAQGRVPGGPDWPQSIADLLARHFAPVDLDRAQLSTVMPGYPRQGDDTDAAHRYRVKRAAAHVDGLHLDQSKKQRRLLEHHAYILGIALSDADAHASPMVVWDGSHRIMQSAFRRRLEGTDTADWPKLDLTQTYKSARQEVFETCERQEIHVEMGGAYVIHRMAVHGVAPWTSSQTRPRTIAYFRPELANPRDWLTPA